jgi:chemotaxis family two-component system response regulator Rcp1
MTMHILLVEDNPADMRLISEALAEGQVPARLQWVSTGEDALACLRRSDTPGGIALPDLILLDLNLPGLLGHEVLAEIKADPALLHIPVVVLSSSSAPQDVKAAYQHHANAYMLKPDDFDQFMALAQTIRAYWLSAVLLPSRAY